MSGGEYHVDDSIENPISNKWVVRKFVKKLHVNAIMLMYHNNESVSW